MDSRSLSASSVEFEGVGLDVSESDLAGPPLEMDIAGMVSVVWVVTVIKVEIVV